MNQILSHPDLTTARPARSVCNPGFVKAFTLVELLVSIAIMSLLMGIVVPSVSRARQSSKRLACGMHLREIGAATFFYLQSEKFFSPLNNLPMDGDWQFNYLLWDSRDFDQNLGPLYQKGLFPDLKV